MRLTRQSEIAVGILAACAERPGEQMQTVRLAEITRTTKAHAARIVALLVRYGYLTSIRGRSGGLRLLADPSRIALGDVLRLTQPELADIATIREPDRRSGKAFDSIVQAAFASFLDMIDRFTVADLVALSPSGRMACLDCSLLNPARRPSAAVARSFTSFPQLDWAAGAAMSLRANRNQAESTDRHALRPAV